MPRLSAREPRRNRDAIVDTAGAGSATASADRVTMYSATTGQAEGRRPRHDDTVSGGAAGSDRGPARLTSVGQKNTISLAIGTTDCFHARHAALPSKNQLNEAPDDLVSASGPRARLALVVLAAVSASNAHPVQQQRIRRGARDR
ncbi:hypothetical protein BOSEA1005_21097 [Hyphomicrobiales bacterium]|nr:hypothetical protein BOSEA1005_21097 [Hyphomicrobiales bacterium]